MTTERLDHGDPNLLAFDARVIEHGRWNETPTVVLDRSAFYPESGGQLGDHGVLSGLRVLDVQIDDAGVVHHLVEGPPPAIGTEVHGDIDRDRRRLHMALHTAQHMLSRALVDEAGAETVSARLGANCTIDVNRDRLDEADVARAEDLVNGAIEDDLVIRAWFPSDTELASLPLRRAPKVKENIRVVDIGGFDVSPCGGTHCTRSAQVGWVRVTGLERYKGKMRVAFAAGRRAREELAAESDVLRRLARTFTCGANEVPTAIEKLRRELEGTRESLGLTRARLATSLASDLLAQTPADANGERRVVLRVDDGDVEFLRHVATRVTADERAVALLAAKGPEGLSVVIARGAASTFDCGAFLKRAATASGGRGGGRPDRAEGRLPPETDWSALVGSIA
jgi:alanyl-tRNA synthetase